MINDYGDDFDDEMMLMLMILNHQSLERPWIKESILVQHNQRFDDNDDKNDDDSDDDGNHITSSNIRKAAWP